MAYQIEFKAMGTTIQVTLDGGSRSDAEILHEVPLWFDEWEDIFSRFRPDSELCGFNRSDGHTFQLSDSFWEVLQLSLEAEKRTKGMVTPAILAPLESAGYVQSFQASNWFPFEPVETTYQFQSLSEQIILLSDRQAAILTPGISLDFGGFAKGWAAQQTMQKLASIGQVMVDAGGDIAVSNPPEGLKGWPIWIENPFGDEAAEIGLQISSGGVATSGKNRRRWTRNGDWMHHLIDPRSGQPSDGDILTATVIGPNVMEAEMASKMIFLSGSRDGMEWIQHQEGFAALVYLDDGQMIKTKNFNDLAGNYEQ